MSRESRQGSAMLRLAITRDISPRIAECELTHLNRSPIDLDKARRQHEAYRSVLLELGCTVARLPAAVDFPDSVFVEDVAVVLGEIIILTRPGAESRRGEVALIEGALRPYGDLRSIVGPATLDGGDVLVQGQDVFIGRSTRTNSAGIDQFAAIAGPLGYRVHAVDVRGCLHLKSAATSIGPDTLLANPEWIAAADFAPYRILAVHPDESHAANALRVADTVVYSMLFPKTADRLEQYGVKLRMVDNSELVRAEGALTCCSLILER